MGQKRLKAIIKTLIYLTSITIGVMLFKIPSVSVLLLSLMFIFTGLFGLMEQGAKLISLLLEKYYFDN